MEDPNAMEGFNALEDFNVPSQERVELLEELDRLVGEEVSKRFWALCQVCDLKNLRIWVDMARLSPWAVRRLATDTIPSVLNYWAQKRQRRSTTPSPRSASNQSPGSLLPPSIPLVSASPQTPTRASISNKAAILSPLNPDSSPTTSALPTKRDNSVISSSPTTSAPPAKRQKGDDQPLSRSQLCKKAAGQRDNGRCVLTCLARIEIAHIYPFFSIKDNTSGYEPRYQFWDSLRMFWHEDKVNTWQNHIFPEGIKKKGIERVDNLISLSSHTHDYWEQGYFALKPISLSIDKKTLKLQFFWQKAPREILPKMSLSTKPPSTKGLEQYERLMPDSSYGICSLYTSNGERIKSGDCFDLKTTDPDTMPLPNFELLEMQWFLQRALGMAGSADEEQLEYWSDDDDDIAALARDSGEDDIPPLDLDESGDISLPHNSSSSPEVPRYSNVRLPDPSHSKHHTEEAEAEEEAETLEHLHT